MLHCIQLLTNKSWLHEGKIFLKHKLQIYYEYMCLSLHIFWHDILVFFLYVIKTLLHGFDLYLMFYLLYSQEIESILTSKNVRKWIYQYWLQRRPPPPSHTHTPQPPILKVSIHSLTHLIRAIIIIYLFAVQKNTL